MPAERVIHKTGLATDDIRQQVDYFLQKAGIPVAMRFIDNAERAFEQIAAMPKIGPLLGLDELPYEDTRRWHIEGFDRLIILYRETQDGIEVIRVLHSSRNIVELLRDDPE